MNRLDNSCCVCHVHIGDVHKKRITAEGEITLKVDKLFKCSQCHFPKYCSKECQADDWKAKHKFVCKYLKELHEQIEMESRVWTGHRMIDLQGAPISYLNGPSSRSEWWGRFAGIMVSTSLTAYLSNYLPNECQGKTALDLGCGNSTSSLYLLQKGWKVIAVDFSQVALDFFKQTVATSNPELLQNQQLNLVCSTIESYTMPSELDLVIASSSLTYCDPQKIHEIMTAIFSSLKKGGLLFGNFFASMFIKRQTQAIEREMGAWFLKDENMARNLLLGHGFEILKCEHGGQVNPNSICFIAKKE